MRDDVAVRPGHGVLRLARTLLVTLPSVALSAAAHSAAGGCVTVLGVLLTGLLLGTSTWTQLARERSGGFLLGWLALGQVLGHGLLELGCRGPAHAAVPTSLSMLELHGVALVVAALVLASGERRVWALARLLAALRTRLQELAVRLVRRQAPPTPVCTEPAAPPSTPHLWHASPWCSLRPVRRGPPSPAQSCL